MNRCLHYAKLFAVGALIAGCGGPEIDDTEAPVGQMTSVKQELSSLGYSTYLGFGGDEYGNALAVDASGNTYITGTTTTFGGTNIFVAKMSPSGTNLYFTYFAGSQAKGIAVDASGNAYVVGTTSAGPTITKVDPTGSLQIYAASLGWSDVTGVKVDSAGNAYVVGSIVRGVAGLDVAVGKVNNTGTAFIYSLAFGGTGTDIGNGIAIDTAGNAYIVGTTSSSNFPVTPSPFQATLRGTQDAFVAKLNATGTTLVYSTYLGGDFTDSGNGIALDSSNNAYVTGSTFAFNGIQSFPVTAGTVQSAPGGGGDAFAVKLNTLGGRVYATYIGGSGAESGASIAVTSTGVAYITGNTTSNNFPTSNLAFQRFASAGANAFVVQLSTTFNAYSYSTYLGGNGTDIGSSIAVLSNAAYVTGNTNSTDFPTSVYAPGGAVDAFVTKFNGP